MTDIGVKFSDTLLNSLFSFKIPDRQSVPVAEVSDSVTEFHQKPS